MSRLRSLWEFLPQNSAKSVSDIEQEIREELEFHIEMRSVDNARKGMSPTDARAAALEQFGNFDHFRRECHQVLLGGRIMWRRIQAGMTVALLIAVIALATIQMGHVQAANRSAANAMTQLMLLSQISGSAVNDSERGSTWNRISRESPIVVETVPKHGALDVDPSMDKIRGTFNNPMMDKSWSWCRATPDTFPEIAGEPKYSGDRKTCTLPIKLAPGKRYIVRFNDEWHDNFQDPTHRPAVPFTLVFETGSEGK